jgi:hypothetical protein
MKICPKCNSTYTDETLNFCLTDGVLLLTAARTLDPEHWQEAETIFDPELKIHQFAPTNTAPNSASGTNSGMSRRTGSFTVSEPKKTNPYFYPLLGVAATLLAIGGIFWWLYVNPASPAQTGSKQNQSGRQPVKRVAVPLTTEQENQVRKEAAEFIERWRATNEKKDIESHIAHYAGTLEIYYDKSGIDKNIVRADRLRAYQRYDSISMSVDNAKITAEAPDLATIVFDKSWTMKSEQKTSTGSVQQEVHLTKQNGKWLIFGEKDLKVYYINNRENTTDSNNASPDMNQ